MSPDQPKNAQPREALSRSVLVAFPHAANATREIKLHHLEGVAVTGGALYPWSRHSRGRCSSSAFESEWLKEVGRMPETLYRVAMLAMTLVLVILAIAGLH